MDDATVSFFIHRIFAKKLKFYFQEELYELLFANNDIQYEADIIYYRIVNEEKYGNWIREENMTEVMTELELWNHNAEPQLKAFEKQLEDRKLDLYNSYKFSTSKQMDTKRRQIRSTERQIAKIHQKKQEFHANTLEGYAEGIKQEYIVTNTLYKNNKLVFDHNNKSEQSYNKFNQLIAEINRHHITNNTYRDIANHDIWRSYWNASKNNIFEGAVSCWSEEQRNLVNTSQMYDSVYSHPECPDDEVIDDHDLLDGWMIKQKRENKRKKKQDTLDKSNKKLSKAGEVFLMGDDLESIKEIQDMNSPFARQVFNQNMKQMHEQGSVDVVDMDTTRTVLVPEQKAAAQLKVRKNF